MSNEQLLWLIGIALGLVILYWLRFVLLAIFGLILAGIVALFAADNLTDGTSLQQLKTRVQNWLNQRVGQ